MKKLPILWDKKAKDNLDNIYDYLAEDSIVAARYVKRELIKLTNSLNHFPEKYPKEYYLKEEPENYRSVAKWAYKIIYEVTDDCLIIVDIFHTSRHPLNIKNVKE